MILDCELGGVFFIYLALFVVLIFFLGTTMEYFVKPGSGILAEGLFELMGLSARLRSARYVEPLSA